MSTERSRAWRLKYPQRANEIAKVGYRKNKERIVQHAKTHRQKRLLVINSLKKSCQICGERDPRCLDFHHRNPSEKTVGIAWGRAGLDTLLKEIEKCDVLCANCHRKLHSTSLPPI